MNARTFVLTGIVAVAVAVSLTACGSSAKVGTPAQANSTTEAAVAAAPAAAATPAAVAKPAADFATRANAAAIGQVVTISDSGVPLWEVSLSAPSLDATALVVAGNQSNEAAPAGMVYAAVTVNVKSLAAKAASPWAQLSVEFVSAAGTTHAEFDHNLTYPGALADLGDMNAHATGSGLIVIAVPLADAAAGNWTVSTKSGETTFFKAL